MNNLLIVIIWTVVRATVTLVTRVNTFIHIHTCTIIHFKMEDPLAAQ